MFIKPSKKWRNPEGDSTVMVPYTYYRLCESYREADGKVRQRTVLGLGELTDFPKESQKGELAEQLTSMINGGEGRICFNRRVHDAALAFYGKWLEEKKEAQDRADKLAEARRKAEEANEVKVSIKLKSLHPEMSRAVGAEHIRGELHGGGPCQDGYGQQGPADTPSNGQSRRGEGYRAAC